MTIQEYMKIAIHGYSSADSKYYRPFFLNMSCEHCIYNGYACRSPKSEGVCIDYRVEKKHKEFKPTNYHEKKMDGQVV